MNTPGVMFSAALQQRVAEQQAVIDRRHAVRYPVSSETKCPFVLPVVSDLGAARVKDVSMEGVGLLLSRFVEPGTLIAIGLMNSTNNFCKTQIVQVMHSTPTAGGYLVGGTFLTPLTYEELRSMLI